MIVERTDTEDEGFLIYERNCVKMKKSLLKKVIAVALVLTMSFGMTATTYAVDGTEQNTTNVVVAALPLQEDTLQRAGNNGMSGAGQSSTGNVTIYYPVQMMGTINVNKGATTVGTATANGTGTYTGTMTLAKGAYELYLIGTVGGQPSVIATGNMTVS